MTISEDELARLTKVSLRVGPKIATELEQYVNSCPDKLRDLMGPSFTDNDIRRIVWLFMGDLAKRHYSEG